MHIIHVQASREIDAPPADIYGVFADYRVAHPAILPKPFFKSLTVTKGGYGAGTEILVGVMGQSKPLDLVVTEPEPGKILLETSRDGTLSTHFIVEPLGASRSRVTITTDMHASRGIKGWIERLLVPIMNTPVYRDELKNVAAYVTKAP